MISSFVPRILESIARTAPSTERNPRKFIIQSLRNRGGVPCNKNYSTDAGHTGVNIFDERLTDEIVEKVHKDGSYIGVWYVARRTVED